MERDSFVNRLRKVYAIYTGGLLSFLIILGIAEQLGLPPHI